MTNPNGDPEGRKLARSRMLQGEEALRLAGVLKRYAEACKIDIEQIVTIERNLNRQINSDRQKATGGKVAAREKFKNTRSHLAMHRLPKNILTLDESGKPVPARSDDDSVFVLAGVALDEPEIKNYRRDAERIKLRFLQRSDVCFHEPHMRNREPMWAFDDNAKIQAQFDRRMRALIEKTQFTAFAVAVRKGHFAREFIETGADPWLPVNVYSVAIEMLLERYVDYLAHRDVQLEGRIIFESQGSLEDAQHQVACTKLLIEGTQWVPSGSFRSFIAPGCEFLTKEPSHPMELADIVAREVFEWVRSDCARTPKFWDVVAPKFHLRGDRQEGKSGLKVFPDRDIREAVLRARGVG